MGRPKKKIQGVELSAHVKFTNESVKQVLGSCDDQEMTTNLLISINGYLMHMDRCISKLTDLETEREERYNSLSQKGGNANAESASRADDAREV